jgi:transposase
MTEPGRSLGSDGGRRRKRFLSPAERYEIWVGLLRGEYTTVQAADRAGVDRTTIMRVRQVAKQARWMRWRRRSPGSEPAGSSPSSLRPKRRSQGCRRR